MVEVYRFGGRLSGPSGVFPEGFPRMLYRGRKLGSGAGFVNAAGPPSPSRPCGPGPDAPHEAGHGES